MFKTLRPLTHDLFKNILDISHCKVVKVVISDLIDNTFYAKIFLQNREGNYQVDARPSDAIAMALHCDSPIFVSD